MDTAKGAAANRVLLDFAACRALDARALARLQDVLVQAVLDGDSTQEACTKAGIRPGVCLLWLETDAAFARQLQWASQRRAYWVEDAVYQTARRGSVVAQRLMLQKLKPHLWGEEGEKEAIGLGYEIKRATPGVVEQLCRRADAAVERVFEQQTVDEFGEISADDTSDSEVEDTQSEQRSSEDNNKEFGEVEVSEMEEDTREAESPVRGAPEDGAQDSDTESSMEGDADGDENDVDEAGRETGARGETAGGTAAYPEDEDGFDDPVGIPPHEAAAQRDAQAAANEVAKLHARKPAVTREQARWKLERMLRLPPGSLQHANLGGSANDILKAILPRRPTPGTFLSDSDPP